MKRIGIVLVSGVFLGACAGGPATPRERGAVTGAAIGAGAGAIIGSASGKPGQGALIGGAMGAVTGAIIGDQAQARERQAAVQPAPVPPPAPPQAPPSPAAGPPVRYEPIWGVYVVEPHPHILFYEGRYYYWDGRIWYAALKWGGPWSVVRVVPVPVAKVPPGHLRGGPPPWAGPKHKHKKWKVKKGW